MMLSLDAEDLLHGPGMRSEQLADELSGIVVLYGVLAWAGALRGEPRRHPIDVLGREHQALRQELLFKYELEEPAHRWDHVIPGRAVRAGDGVVVERHGKNFSQTR